jgi:hypothetical protein
MGPKLQRSEQTSERLSETHGKQNSMHFSDFAADYFDPEEKMATGLGEIGD